MVFKETKVVRDFFQINELPILKTNSTYELKLSNVTLNLFITSAEKIKNRLLAYGYFFDEGQWYLAEILFTDEIGKNSSIVLSPRATPLLIREQLVEYYLNEIKKISSITENLA